MATVKGDVHDIGKNIVGVVLACNNYEIIDLGVMVPAAKILQTAREQKVDIIGLSGLITPSLDEMVHVAAEMEREGFDIPLLIGGATTSRVHTAVKIHPRYTRGQTVYVTDASRAVGVVSACCRPRPRAAMSRRCGPNTRRSPTRMPAREADKQRLPLAKARANAHKIDWAAYEPPKPSFLGTKVFEDWDLAELARYIDWTPFFQTWELKGRYPKILEDEAQGPAARQLFDDAQAMLKKIIAEKWFAPSGVIGFWPANAVGDDIRLFTDEARRRSWRPSSRCASSWPSATARPMSRCPISSRRSTAASPTMSAASSSPPASRKWRSPSASSAPMTTIPRSWSRRWPTASPKPLPSACTSGCARNSGAMRRTRTWRPTS